MRESKDVVIVEGVFYTDGDSITYKLKEYRNEYKGIIKISKTGSIKIVRKDRNDKYIPENKVNIYDLYQLGKDRVMVFDSDYNKDIAINVFKLYERDRLQQKINFNELLLEVVSDNKILNE